MQPLRIFYRPLLCAMVCLAMTGCAPRAKETKADLIVWHWMTDREEALIKLAERYKQETGIEVHFELYAPSDAYTQKVRASAQAGTLPDIYGILGEKRDLAAFIKAGHVADLTEEMFANNMEWMSKFASKAIAVNEFLPGNEFSVKPGIYGVPIDVTSIRFLYNKSLFRKAGLDPERPPKTWEEFVSANASLKKAGIQGLVSGWGEIWMIDCLMSNLAFNIMGEAKVVRTIRGEASYNDPDWIRVFSLFKELADKKMLAEGVVTMVNKTAEQNFANGRAAFAFNGSWCVNVYHGMNPNLEYGVFLPPRVSDRYPVSIWGGAGSSFIVNGRPPNKIKAINFLKWLTAKEAQVSLAKGTRNIPSNKEALRDIPPILMQFASDMELATHPNVLPAAEFPQVIEALDKGIQSILIGEKTPEALAADVQAVKERELGKRSNRR